MVFERQNSKPEIASQKRVVKLTPAIGDWTTYKPPKVLVKKVKTGLYGFDRLSKEEMNTVLLVHYRFLQGMLKRFKIDLGMAVELFSIQVEQTTYLNFLRGLNGPIVQCKITIPDRHEPILLYLDLALANSLINYALGSFDTELLSRGLTEAEQSALAATLGEYLPGLSRAFEGTIDGLELAVVSSPDVVMDPTITSTTTLATFGAEVSLADNPPARLFFAYSGHALRGLISAYKQREKSRPLDFSRLPGNLLQKITAPVAAVLGETSLTTQELNEFEVGDVVSLETSINGALLTTVGNIKLSGQPGTRHKKNTVRIVGLRESTDIELPPPLAEEEKPKVSPPAPTPTKPTPIPEPTTMPKPIPATELPSEPATTPETGLEEEDWLEDEEFSEDLLNDEAEIPPQPL